jgi:hypothetical protein
MVGNMVKGICGNWIGIQNRCWSVGTKVDVRMMIAMLGASGMCGWFLWLWRYRVVGSVFGSFSSWTPRKCVNPLSYVKVHLCP